MYMPPEQIYCFKKCKPPVDIYAMGVTLYYLLTGRYPLDFPPPWQFKNWARQKKAPELKKDPIQMILDDSPRPIREWRKDLPVKLSGAIDKAVRKDANHRFQTAEEFRSALVNAVN